MKPHYSDTASFSGVYPMAETFPKSEWRWFGKASHFICGHDCRFHLATQVGPWLVSTVGEYLPDSSTRDILAESRGIVLKGKGDERRASWMQQVGYEEIGYQRTYETMVFRAGEACGGDCGCGVPQIDGPELDFRGYNNAGDATAGHMELCAKWASRAHVPEEETGGAA